jgi:hypothetical protein
LSSFDLTRDRIADPSGVVQGGKQRKKPQITQMDADIGRSHRDPETRWASQAMILQYEDLVFNAARGNAGVGGRR